MAKQPMKASKEEPKKNVPAPVKTGNAVAAGYDYGDSAGEGFEGTKSSDLSIPFWAVLQSNSPQVVDQQPKGAKAGQWFNTVTGELRDEIYFMPCYKENKYVEWVPRDKGGGFVGVHAIDSEVARKAIAANEGNKMGKLKVGSNDLIDTNYVYGLNMNADGTATDGFAVIAFTSTKQKPYRDWMTALYLIKGKPPLYAHRAKLGTVKQENEKGKFFNVEITPLKGEGGWVGSLIHPKNETELLEEGKNFRDMVVSGMAKADFSRQNATGGNEAQDGGEAPF